MKTDNGRNFIFLIQIYLDNFIIINLDLEMKNGPQAIFQTLQETQTYTLKSILASDLLKLRFIIKNKGKTNQVYDTLIRSLENEGKLPEYFQTLEQLKQYLKTKDNIKVDTHKKTIQIVSKGPTKKSGFIQLAHFKLHPVQFAKKNSIPENKATIQTRNISTEQAEQWVDTLATEIVNIIQNKSRMAQKSQTLNQYVKKSQVDTLVQQVRRELQAEIAGNKKQIQKIKQTLRNRQNRKSSLKNSYQAENLANLIKQLPNQSITQVTQLKWQIQQLSHKIDQGLQEQRQQYIDLLKQELQITYQTLVKQINNQFSQVQRIYVTKDQMDVFIKKMQVLGSKLQTLSQESAKNQINNQKNIFELGFSGRVSSQYALKTARDKQKESWDNQSSSQATIKSPKKMFSASQYIPISPVNSQGWIDPKCSHFGRVSLNGNAITMSSYGGAILFGKMPIKKASIFHISIQSLKGKFAIGVIDSSYKQNLLYGDEQYRIYYQSNKKFVCGQTQKQNQGQGLFKGQTITVCVDLKLGTILWKVGSNLKHSWQSDDLRNQKIQWVPLIKLFQKGDRVSIVE